MTREEAIKELEEDKALYMPEEWIESLDRDTPDGRLITALDMAIKALEQEPKTGHWIDHQEGRWIYAMCSECETVHDIQTNFCPNCVCAMVEPQKSEDKE